MHHAKRTDRTNRANYANSTGGFTALATTLVVLAVVTTISITLALASIDGLQTSFAQLKGTQARALAQSCISEALFELYSAATIPSAVVLPEGSCVITLDNQSGSEWTFTTTATLDSYSKSIQVSAQRLAAVEITLWQEL